MDIQQQWTLEHYRISMVRGCYTRYAGWWLSWVVVLCCGFITTASATQSLSADLEAEELPALMRQQAPGEKLRLERIPLDPSRPSATFQLERFEVFSHDAQIVVHGDGRETTLSPPTNVYYRGHIEGDSESLVYLALHARGGLRGVIKSAEQFWVMEGATADGRLAALPRLRQIDPRTEFNDRSFQCDNDHLGDAEPPGLWDQQTATPIGDTLHAQAASQASSYTARIAIETDWEFFQKFGSATAATDYIGDLVGYSSALYAAEVGTSLLISHISLWSTSSDPWQQTSTTCGIFEFGRYWNDNRSAIPRTTAHFLSGKSTGGGFAWIGVLCRGSFAVDISGEGCSGLTPSYDNYGGAYGFSGSMDGDFDIDNPRIVGDVALFNHELGHNFNSPHTHCYAGIGGNASPVDQCYGSESGCYSGPNRLPGPAGQGSGTMMSYCHLLGSGYSNISLTFGKDHPYGVAPDRVPTRMSEHVATTAAANPGCFALQGPFTFIVNKAGTGSGTVTSTPAGIDCGGDCSEMYDEGTAVVLTATPVSGSVFAGWSGEADCSDGSVTMTAPKACTATFDTIPPPVGNDHCANATSISATPFTNTVNTTGATTEASDPAPGCGSGSRNKSVWYRFTASSNGTVTADTFGSTYDTVLSTYTGSCGGLSAVANGCNDDTGGGGQSSVTLAVTQGTTYSFMVSDYSTTGGGGTLVFNLTFTSTTSQLAVTSPNGGEVWPIGSTQSIRWSASGFTGTVKVQLSRDNGTSWATLFGSTANDGVQNWKVTTPTTTQALIRICSVSTPALCDTSNAAFTLGGGSLTVTVPNGGETWPIGSTQPIRWTSSGITGKVKIEVSRNGASGPWTAIINATVNDGAHNSKVKAPASTQVRIRVSSVDNPSVVDTSDSNVTIR